MTGQVHEDKPIQQLDDADTSKRAGMAALLAFSGLIIGFIVMIVLVVFFSQREPVAKNESEDAGTEAVEVAE